MTVAEFINKVGFKVDQESVNKVNGTIKEIKSTATKLLGAIGIGLSLTAINGLVEEFGAANKQIKAAVGGVEDLTAVQDKMLAKANEARLVYGDMVGYVSNLTKAGDIFPVDDAMQFTSTVAKLMKTNSRNDSQISSMMEGFNKSFQKGIVDSETLNKMLEQAPETANVLAQSLGVAKSQLLDMASKGTMTVQQLKDAFMDSSGEIEKAFAESNMSISDGLKSIRNKWGLWLAQMNATLGVTNTIAHAMVRFSDIAMSGMNKVRNAVVWLGDKLGGTDKVLKLLAISVGAFLVATKAGKIIDFLGKVGKMLSGINLQAMKIMAVIILIALLVEDFINFLQGNDSLIGELFDSAGIGAERARNAIARAFNAIKNVVLTVWGTITSFLSEHGEAIREMFARIWDAVSQIFSVAFAVISTLVKVVFGGLQIFWAKWGDKITAVLSQVAEFFNRTFGRLISIVTQFAEVLSAIFAGDIKGALQSLLGIFQAIFEQIIDTVRTIFTAVWTFIGEKVTQIKDSIVDGFTAAIEWIKSLPEQALQWGADIIQGIVDGIKGAIGKIGEAVSGVAEKIKGFLGFSEPDEGPLSDFHTYMPDMIDLMAQGISAGKAKIRDALGALTGDMSVVAQANVASPGTARMAMGGNSVSKSVVQNVNINNRFEGDRAGQQKSATAMKKAGSDITKELAHGLAYAR